MTSSARFSPVFVSESEGPNFVSNAPGYFTHIDAFISLQTDPLYTGITDPVYTGITDPVYTGITDPVSSEYSAINPKKQSDCMPPRM
jgi:hypothetical protein